MCLPSTNSNGPPRFEAYMMTGDIIINLAKDISSNTNSSNTSASEFSSLKEPSPSKIPLSIGRRRGRGVIAAAAATATATAGGGGGGGGGVGVASRIATRIISPTTQANNTSTTSEMDQTESSMSEGYSFFSNLSSGSDTFNVVSNECANESPCNNIVSNNNNNNINNNNNNNNKDNHQHVRSYKGLRQQHNSYPSPNHNSNHNHNHMASLSWSSSSASSEISYDSTSDSANESTHPANGDTSTNASVNGQITSTPRVPSETTSLTSSTSITTIITTTATTTTTTTPITPTKPSTPTTPTTTYSNSAKHYPNHPHLHHHYNCENKNSKYERPCSPNVNSSRYPSFISPSVKDFENKSDSDMGKSSSYETFHYQYQHQEQQKYQHHNYRYCDDSVASEDINDHGDDNSNQQQEQEQDQKSSNTSKEEKEQCQQQPQQQDQPQQQQQQQHHQQQQSTTPQENQETPSTVLNLNVSSISSSSSTSENESSSEDEMEIPENCHYSPPKSVDRDAASRLAKRLYHLEGFKRSDVCRHLSKNNDFSRIVAEEYLKYFDFKGDTLDGALRKFLTSFCLIGETQERERVLQHFSKRYLDCNPNTLKSSDALHTLTCAIMLLNTDLHGENVGRKMTCNEFIDNLSDLNDGEDFPRDVLVSIYQSIKGEPLQWAFDDDGLSILNGVNSRLGLLGSGSSSSSASSSACASSSSSHNPALLGNNPFLKLPNPNTATEYKRGYIMRKCCFDMNGKRTPFGKRGWKMFYATLRDLVLFLHKDEQGFRKNQLYESLHNSIRIHHALAAPATDYTKKQHVFRLQTADQSEYLFQTSDAQELQSWVDTINLVAGTLSAPSLPSAVGSQSLKKFQKPLLPSSHTKFNTKEQLADHEMRIQRIAQELEEHVSKHPDKGANRRILNEYAEKQSYLEFELKRYSTYASILRTKLHQAFGSGALLEGPSNNKLLSSLSSKSKPLNQLSIGEEQDIDEEKWAEEGHTYQEQVTVKQVSRSHR